MASKVGGLRPVQFTIQDSLDDILPKRNVHNKRRALNLKNRMIHAAQQYSKSFKSGKRYQTDANDTLKPAEGEFAVDIMYSRWFENSNIFDQIRVLSEHCSYCYLSDVDELDHYCDKNTYPEVAVLPANLVPACENCNQRKKSGANFFQPYFEDISQYGWLKCQLKFKASLDTPVPNYFIVRPDEMSKEKFERLEAQLDGTQCLNLATGSAGQEVMAKWESWASLVQSTSITENGLAKFFEKIFKSRQTSHGNNDWECLLYKELTANSSVIFERLKMVSN